MQSSTYNFKYSTQLREKNRENTVIWTLQNMEEVLKCKTYKEIRTKASDYPDDTDEDSKFQLKIHLVGRENDLLEIYFAAPITVNVKSVVYNSPDCYGRYTNTIGTKDYQWVPAKQWQLLGVQMKQSILSRNTSSGYSMKFDFIINRSHNDKEYCLYNNEHRAQLNSDIENLLINPLFSDVILKSVEGMEFCAHKAVLATRSPVLQAHFQHNTLESVTNIVESPFESEVLQEVINFIYTAKTTSKLDEIPERLLEAADYYQLYGLKDLCEESLQAKLTVDNVVETLKLADLHSAPKLKKETLMFINDGRAKEVIETKGWETLESVALIKIIYEYQVKKQLDFMFAMYFEKIQDSNRVRF